MSEWPRVRVKDVCELIVDCVNRTAPVVDGPTPYRMIRTTNVREGRIDLSTCRYVEKETFERWARRASVEDGDVILTREAPIGEVGFVKNIGHVFLGQRIMQYRANRKKIDPRFLYYSFRSPDLQHQFRTHDGSGSVVSHIRVADCHEFLVPLAPLEQQAAIGELLGALDDKIELNRRMNKTLEAMARAIFKDWFVEFGPTRAKMDGRAPYLAPGVWALFPDCLDANDKPEGWRWGALSDCACLNSESWSRANYPEWISYVDLSGTKWGSIDTVEQHNKQSAPSRAQRILKPGDTIVGTVRPGNGSYAFVSSEGLTGSTGFAVLRPKNIHSREFVYLAATAAENIDRLAHLADGGAYPAVRPDVVERTGVIIAPAPIMQVFHEMTAPLVDRCEANKSESSTLAALRDLLLPKLMSGEIRVNDADRIITEAAQ